MHLLRRAPTRYALDARATTPREESPIAPPDPRLALAAPAIAAEALPDLADEADRAAVARTLAGDVEAFAVVVRRHARGLTSLCGRMAGDPRLGEELAQDALARAYASLASFRGDCRFRHWLYRIAVNGCRDFLKAGARAERPAEIAGDALVNAMDPERGAVARQAVAALAVEVAQLPPKYRVAFTLFHVENMPYDEIEAITGVKVNALKVRVHRARLMLRERLGELVEEEALP